MPIAGQVRVRLGWRVPPPAVVVQVVLGNGDGLAETITLLVVVCCCQVQEGAEDRSRPQQHLSGAFRPQIPRRCD